MAQELEITRICGVCGGDGVRTTSYSTGGAPVENNTPCTSCNEGRVHAGFVTLDPSLEDTMDRLLDITEKVDEIKTVVDAL
jgi:hypothetical protein